MAWKVKRSAARGGTWLPFGAATPDPVDPPEEPNVLQVGIDIDILGVTSAPTKPAEIQRVAEVLGTWNDGQPRPLGNRCKFFDGAQGLADTVNSYESSGYDGLPILCHKVDDTNAYNTRLGQITKPEIWVYMQEWQRVTNVTDLNTVYQNMDAARRAHPNGHLVDLLVVDSGYQNLQAPNQWQQIDHAAAHINWVAEDHYMYPNLWNDDPSYLFGGIYGHHQKAMSENYPEYKGWGLSEYGVSAKNGDGTLVDPNTRAGVMHQHFTWLQNNGATWVNYWESDYSDLRGNPANDWLLEDASIVTEFLTWLDRRDLQS